MGVELERPFYDCPRVGIRLGEYGRQFENECASNADLAFHVDISPVLAEDLLADG
jgi:hypothetical protein